MEKYSLENFTKWWLIGNFEPSLFPTDLFEVAVKVYTKWTKEAAHYHKIATEFTIINEGKFKMNGMEVRKWDIIRVNPNEIVEFECLEDGSNTVVKIPCAKDDKYMDTQD